MQLFRVLFILAVTVVVAGCQTAPVTGRKQFMLVPESQAIEASTEAYAQVLAPIQKQGKLNDNPAMKARVDTDHRAPGRPGHQVSPRDRRAGTGRWP